MLLLCFRFRYEEYAIPMQRAFDTVVDTKLDLLRGFTLDERAARLREQDRNKQVSFWFVN